ncbi:MAG: hypothetical protein C0624_04235 [Desulfuromonas sp.]|nr:MAG: hypothetical protein C0624_04235 [Desulfuromonas sp.]
MKILRVSNLLLICLLAGAVWTTALVAEEEPARQDVLYMLDCDKDCHCNSVSTEPGAIPCGKPMKWHHVVKVVGDEALLCSGDEGCHCTIDPDDDSKCSCGKPVKRVSLKGQGIYFCNCAGSCTCNTLAPEPGPCRCGMKLKKVD